MATPCHRRYDGYDIHIKRVDAVRYFYIYHYGGVYLDLDQLCLRGLEQTPLLPGMATFGFIDRGLNCSRGDCIRGGEGVPNAFMAAPPRHPFFAHVIKQLPKTRNDLFNGRLESHPNAATGPTFLTRSLAEWARRKVRAACCVASLSLVKGAKATAARRSSVVATRPQGGAGVNIRPNPVIYNAIWTRRRHMCGHGAANAHNEPKLETRLAIFEKCARSILPRAVTTSFWTHSWVAPRGNASNARNSTR